MATRIYLDHAATTPVATAAREAMAVALGSWANPSSPHAEGRAARAALEEARGRIAAALGWGGTLILTSGATEAIALAAGNAKAGARLACAVEHDAVRRVAAPTIACDEGGRIDLASLATALSAAGPAPLVIAQSVNNETGVIQPLADVAAAVRAAGGLLLADCAQSAGKLPLPEADFIAISAHKLGGPPGIGALLVRDPATLDAIGGQEKGYRPGTENVPAAIGFAAALAGRRAWMERAAEFRQQLDRTIAAAGGELVAAEVARLPTIASYRMPGVPAAAQLIQFDLAGIAVSAGSACSSGSVSPSHVLAAMGWDEAHAREVIRISFGPATSRTDVYRCGEVWTKLAADAKRRAA
ncbi:aminotransferase class V-fold PLP-dependent enzyme [Sphingomonas profundi]|uniref:aminotransferase class V-fold PLP-dependent enzyme n=1 Tax=Alterirhizorhabdus profundi TaxID=2681549 RepID=UPI0012E7F898|nr:aminotransferase class V-fold PLP-dependent enzyme [Sphingomonas profundi]